MAGAFVPVGEHGRRAAVAAYEILDSPPEQIFDELAQLATDLCGAPISLVGFVDGTRVWFKARVGFDPAELPMAELGFGAAIVESGEPLEVADATGDERFSGLPLVAGEQGIRFFAGAPLVVPEGPVIGFLGVLDSKPRVLTGQQRDGLRALARQIVDLLELRRAVAEARRAQRELRASADWYRSMVDTTQEWIREHDRDGRVTYSNPAVERILGYRAEDVIGTGISDLVVADDHSEIEARMARLVEVPGDSSSFSARFRHRDGGTRWLEGDIVARFDTTGAVVGFRSTFHDVTDRTELQLQLIDLVGLDDLTGLRNRGGFLRSAEDQLKLTRRRGTPLVLLFIDVDGLKQVNDGLGHAAGDHLLRDAADLLATTFRESDVVARVGGDEFCVLLTSDASEAWLAIRRLLDAIEEHHKPAGAGRPYELSLSIGSATFDPERPCTIEELMEQADRAMYANKRARRAQPRLRTPRA